VWKQAVIEFETFTALLGKLAYCNRKPGKRRNI